MKSKKRSSKSIGREIIDGLTDLVETLEQGKPLNQRFTVRTASIALKPRKFRGKDIRMVRQKLHASQSVFAQILGVDVGTVQSWEQGVRNPSSMANRFLDEIDRAPEHFMQRISLR